MGLIQNGTAEAVVPTKTLFAVNYPGYPTSLARAIQTLGGEDSIAKARLSDSNYLELRFRPEDPFAHPVFGEPCKMSGLLLRLSKVKEQESTMGGIKATIIAKVNQYYNFTGMADYQYVAPVHADLVRGKKRRHLQHFQREHDGVPDMDQEEMMILPPPLFSVKDIPEDLIARPSEAAKASHRQALLAEQPWEMEITPCFNLDFKIKEIPPKTSWQQKLCKNSEEWHVQCAIDKLFEKKPIWAKSSIHEQLLEQNICLTDNQLRRCLFRLAYYFAYGPFRHLWIKNNYDPRKDPESRVFQMVDFRVPKSVRDDAQAYASDTITWKHICSFKQAPLKKFSYLQLFDLEDDFIQSTIRRPPERLTCSEYTGWFNRSTIAMLRQQVRVRFLHCILGDKARNLEQRELKKLEGLKQAELITNAQRHAEDSAMKWTEETTCLPESTEPSLQNSDLKPGNPNRGQEEEEGDDVDDDDDDDDDEEEEEEEEEEDEDENHEQQVLDARSADFYTDPFDSVPKTYLQELLEKFPMSSDDKMRGVDLSDEEAEYAIYEQEEEDE